MTRFQPGRDRNLLNSAASALALSLALVPSLLGCGSGGGQSVIGISPSSAQVMDAGQTLAISATVVNDAPAFGAAYSLSGPGSIGPESITRVASTTIVAVTYASPSSVTAQTAVKVTATSQNTPSQSASVSITLNPALVITTTTLPSGNVNAAYSATLASTGGSGGLVWLVASGSLPAGLQLSKAGVLNGTPTAYGTFNFTVSLTDAATTPNTVTQAYTLTIIPQQPVITTTQLPNGVSGVAYSQQLTYTGGNASTPIFTVASGALPGGLSLTTGGLISGTPTNAAAGATYTFGVTVAVGAQTSATATLSIIVPPLPVVTTTSLPNGNVGIAYSKQLNYNGGAGGTVTWAISPTTALTGSGLSLSSSGLLSGNPSTATTYTFSVTVTVGPQTSAPQSLSLNIQALSITSATSASGEVGLPFSFQLSAAGGKPGYTWSSTTLPAGLSLNSATGLITGTPTNPGTVNNVTVTATDTVGGTASQQMSFSIASARSSAKNSEFSGQYAFLMNGFDSGGAPLAAVGSLTVDGNGNITSGTLDTNGTGTATVRTNYPITGTYSVGPDNRGKFTVTVGGAPLTFVLVLNGLSNGVATSGYLTEFDNTGQSLTGVLAQQTASAFTTSAINNGFAFGLHGFAAGSTSSTLAHRSAAGELQFNGTGGISSTNVSEFVESGSTTGQPQTPISVSLSIAATGRGTLTLVPATGSAQHFTVYVVSAGKFFLLSSDAAMTATGTDLLSGQALQQTVSYGSFTVASLSGAAVVRTEAYLPSLTSASYPDVRVGLYSFTASNGSVQFTADENAGGAVKTVSQTGTFTVSSYGRVTASFASGFGGCTNCVGGGNTYFYLAGANTGFLMDSTTGATSGSFEPQTATNLSSSSFNGSYAVGTLRPLSPAATYLAAELVANGTGSAAGTADENTNGTLAPDVALAGTYVVAPATGRTTLTGIGSNTVLYVISPTRALALDLGAATPVVEEVVQ